MSYIGNYFDRYCHGVAIDAVSSRLARGQMQMTTLSKFISELRAELATAITDGKDEELRFVASNIELELQIGAETKTDGTGTLSFKVFGVGAEGTGGVAHASNSGQRITLSLSLVDKTGKSPFIGADAASSRT